MNDLITSTLFDTTDDTSTQATPHHFAEIILPLPFDQTFSYHIPQGLVIEDGSIVRISFRNRSYYGVVERVWDSDDTPSYKTQPILEKADIDPIHPNIMKFLKWMSHYTVTPLGNILKLLLCSKEAFTPQPPEIMYRLDTIPSNLRMTESRKRLLDVMKSNEAYTKAELVDKAHISLSVINGLINLNIFTVEQRNKIPVTDKIDETIYNKPTLSEQQQKAADLLVRNVMNNCFSVTLLDGVTGSGKTETYCEAIEKILLETEGQVLVLLPEIALTSQVLTRFETRFGFKPAIWHSNQTKGKRATIWQNISNGTTRLVIGARSALFLPFRTLKLIIVDEEHESSYKQEEGVIYHARDMAVARGYHEGISVILASATPSLETMHNVITGKYQTISLPSRYGAAVFPTVIPIDMRNESLESDKWVSPTLRSKIIENYQSAKQSMLYINRRGYAPLTICRECGTKIECPNCSGWLSVHQRHKDYRLLCHHCGYMEDFPEKCSNCGAGQESIIAYGPGVEKIAEELQELLPEANIAVMTSDRVGTGDILHQTIEAITNGEIDIIVGTQMITKGYHFPKLSLVGVLDSEIGVAGGDLRGAEKTYQLLHQVAGRAGREKDKGYVYIQSYAPDSDLIDALVHNDRNRFTEQELCIREDNEMPPFSRLASIIISSENENEAKHFAYHVRAIGNLDEFADVLGPAPAAIYKLRTRFRYRILIKTPKSLDLSKIMASWIKLIEVPASIKLKVDIDPYHFL